MFKKSKQKQHQQQQKHSVLYPNVCPHCNLDFCPFPFWGLFLIKVDFQRIHAIGMYEAVFFSHIFRAICTACAIVAICALWCFAFFFPSLFFLLLLPARKAKLYHILCVKKLDILIIIVRKKVIKSVCKMTCCVFKFSSVGGVFL